MIMPQDNARLIVLTGATRGCGRALTDSFIAAGHTVVGCGTSPEAVRGLSETYGAPHDFAVVDIADADAVAAWADRVIADVGTPDLVVNNAARINASTELWNVPAAEFSDVVDVNVKGTAYVAQRFLPAMIARGSGVLVNFSSGWGRSTSPKVAPYCTTKWAVEGLTSALAQELPPGLAAVALSPGVVHTEMLVSCMGDDAALADTPEVWARRAAPYVLALGPENNGQSLSVT